jgi:GNAT superfamily N-acetyltransferase
VRRNQSALSRPTLAPDGVEIRFASDCDADDIHDVLRRSVYERASGRYTAEQLAGWVAGRCPADYRAAMARGETLFVATIDGRVLGFAALVRREVQAVYVAPEGRGLGVRLLVAVEIEARGRGLTRLDVHASLNAADFYRSHGYEGDDVVEITLPGGTRIESVVMHKSLTLPVER